MVDFKERYMELLIAQREAYKTLLSLTEEQNAAIYAKESFEALNAILDRKDDQVDRLRSIKIKIDEFFELPVDGLEETLKTDEINSVLSATREYLDKLAVLEQSAQTLLTEAEKSLYHDMKKVQTGKKTLDGYAPGGTVSAPRYIDKKG